MAKTQKGPGGLPSKEQGKKSGVGRDNLPPKSAKSGTAIKSGKK
jgi:hypothetical protein